MGNKPPEINFDIEKLLEDNKGLIEDTLTAEIKERIKRKIKYDLGLGSLLGDWMEDNVAPAVTSYLDNHKEEIIKKYLSAYEKALNNAVEERAKDMCEKATGYSFQKALKEL